MDGFVDAMRYIRAHDGSYPPTLHSIQEKNELGDPGIPDEVIERTRQDFLGQNLVQRGDTDILLCLVDGFFLYSNSKVVDELDLRLLVRAPYHKLKARREARNGYVTLERKQPVICANGRLLAGSSGVLRQDSMEELCE